MAGRFAAPVSDSNEPKLRSSAIPLKLMRVPRGELNYGRNGPEQELLKLTRSLE